MEENEAKELLVLHLHNPKFGSLEEHEVSFDYPTYKKMFYDVCREILVRVELLKSDQFGLSKEWNEKLLHEYHDSYVTYFVERLFYEETDITEIQLFDGVSDGVVKDVMDRLESLEGKRNESMKKMNSLSKEKMNFVNKIGNLFSDEAEADDDEDSDEDDDWKEELLKNMEEDKQFCQDIIQKLLCDGIMVKVQTSKRAFELSAKLKETYGELTGDYCEQLESREIQLSDLSKDENLNYFLVRDIRSQFFRSLFEKYIGGKSKFLEVSLEKWSVKQLLDILMVDRKLSSLLCGNDSTEVSCDMYPLCMYIVKNFFLSLIVNKCVTAEAIGESKVLSSGFKQLIHENHFGRNWVGQLVEQRRRKDTILKKELGIGKKKKKDAKGSGKLISKKFMDRLFLHSDEVFEKEFHVVYKDLEKRGLRELKSVKKGHSEEFMAKVLHKYFGEHLNLSPSFNCRDEEKGLSIDKVMNEFVELKFKLFDTIEKNMVYYILLKSIRLFRSEPNVVHFRKSSKAKSVVIVGDLHGQLYSLLHIFQLKGYPCESKPFVFNGDYIDKAAFPVEVLLVLLCFKIMYPNCVYMTRGNHENEVDEHLGFPKIVKEKYGKDILLLFLRVFRWLPLAVVVDQSIMVIHGGIGSKQNSSIKSLNKLRRYDPRGMTKKEFELLLDVLWCDPVERKGIVDNKARGVSVLYGSDVTKTYLKKNNLKLIVRSHEMIKNGYEVKHQGKSVTIHSSTSLKFFKAAVLEVDSDLNLKFDTYGFIAENFTSLTGEQKFANCCSVQ